MPTILLADDNSADAERCYREGWVLGADGPAAARKILGSRQVGEFEFTRCA